MTHLQPTQTETVELSYVMEDVDTLENFTLYINEKNEIEELLAMYDLN